MNGPEGVVPGRGQEVRGAAGAAPRPRGERSGQKERPATRVMVASTGSTIDPAVIRRAAELAHPGPAAVYVLSVARIWGVKWGLPNPGLYPTKREWDEQRDIVAGAAAALRKRGLDVKTKVIASRNEPKAIASWATALGCTAIVIGQPELSHLDRILHGEDARMVARFTSVPVHPVEVAPAPRRTPFGIPKRSAG